MPPSNPWACQRSDQAPRVEKPWSPRPKCTSAAQSDSGIIHTSMIEVPMPNHISMRKWWTLGIIGHHCVMFQDYAQFALFPASMVIADNTRKRLSWSLGWVSSHCLRSSIALRLRQVAVTFLLRLNHGTQWNSCQVLLKASSLLQQMFRQQYICIGCIGSTESIRQREQCRLKKALLPEMTGWWLQPPGKCLPFYKCRKTLETWNHRPKVRICGFCAGIRARLLKQPSSKTSRLQQHDLPSPNLELGPHFQLHWPFLIKSCFLQVLNINKKRKKTAHKKTAKIIHGIPLLTRTLHSLVQKRVSTTTPKHVTSKISHPYQAHPLKCSLKSLPTQPTPPKKNIFAILWRIGGSGFPPFQKYEHCSTLLRSAVDGECS